jgi:hypothetical protein
LADRAGDVAVTESVCLSDTKIDDAKADGATAGLLPDVSDTSAVR